MTVSENNQNYNRFFHEHKQHHVVKVLPGGLYSTDEREMISTGLGSCVAACIWDPTAHVGGMNHFLLPDSGLLRDSEGSDCMDDPFNAVSNEARYGSYAMEILINQLLAKGRSVLA